MQSRCLWFGLAPSDHDVNVSIVLYAGMRPDRWHNSGGSKAARSLPPEDPVIRRRYGSIRQHNGKKYRYHEYCLINHDKETDQHVSRKT